MPQKIQELLEQFPSIKEKPTKLPLLRDIQNNIDLISGFSLPNLPHYRISPKEYEILHQHIEELLKKRHIQPNISHCTVPTLLAPKKRMVVGEWMLTAESSTR